MNTINIDVPYHLDLMEAKIYDALAMAGLTYQEISNETEYPLSAIQTIVSRLERQMVLSVNRSEHPYIINRGPREVGYRNPPTKSTTPEEPLKVSIPKKIVAILQEHGPQTAAEIGRLVGKVGIAVYLSAAYRDGLIDKRKTDDGMLYGLPVQFPPAEQEPEPTTLLEPMFEGQRAIETPSLPMIKIEDVPTLIGSRISTPRQIEKLRTQLADDIYLINDPIMKYYFQQFRIIGGYGNRNSETIERLVWLIIHAMISDGTIKQHRPE